MHILECSRTTCKRDRDDVGKLFQGTAESIPQTELIDTTGAGDAFIGAVLYSICANMPPEKMLPFAAQVVRNLVFLGYLFFHFLPVPKEGLRLNCGKKMQEKTIL